MIEFTKEELERYSRQILLFGRAGQLKLKKARVGLIGLGGLGNPALIYLAASGVGYIRIADNDVVERHNLSRQVLFSERDCGVKKTQIAQEKISHLNPYIQLESFEKVDQQSLQEFCQNLDLVLEGSDDLALKFFCNDFCYQKRIPLIIGAMGPEQGHVFPVFKEQACYRCIFWDLPQEEIPTCANSGVISPMAGVLGSMMASLCVQFLAQGRIPKDLLIIEHTKWRNLSLKINPYCKNH